MTYNIPLAVPNFEGNEVEYVSKAVAEGWVSTGGAYINELEGKMAEFLHTDMAVACQSGTAALHLAMVDCGVMPGTAVLVPAITFIAAVNPVKYQFAEPVFVGCDDGITMDPELVRAFCENECDFDGKSLRVKKSGNLVKAMVVVHVFGNMADMEALMDLAEKYNITVIEDATEALGTKYTSGKYAGKMAGTIGDYGCYSYNGNKIITTGGGGMLVARDKKRAEHIKYLSTQAKDDHLFYIHNEVGYNYRMTNVQAALGVAQMEELEDFIGRKQRNYTYYREALADAEKMRLLSYREGTESNSWFYALWIDMEKLKCDVRELVLKLEEFGVHTRPIWGLINEQTPYRDGLSTDMTKARDFASHIINIPCSTNITKDEMDYVVETLKRVIKEMEA